MFNSRDEMIEYFKQKNPELYNIPKPNKANNIPKQNKTFTKLIPSHKNSTSKISNFENSHIDNNNIRSYISRPNIRHIRNNSQLSGSHINNNSHINNYNTNNSINFNLVHNNQQSISNNINLSNSNTNINNSSINMMSNYNNSKNNINNYSNNNNNNIKRWDKLYQLNKVNQSKLESKRASLLKFREEEELSNCTFSPKLVSSRVVYNDKINKGSREQNVFERTNTWKLRNNNKINELRNINKNKENEECLFKPVSHYCLSY